MKIKGIILLSVLLVSALFIFGCVASNEEPIGGSTDDYGCLVGAGYSFDENVGACTRNWELNESQKTGAKIAVDFVGFEKGLTIVEVIVYKCSSCYLVTLSTSEQKQKVVQIIGGVSFLQINDGGNLTNVAENFDISFDENSNVLYYSFVVNKPTPCYATKVDELVMESFPEQIVIYVDLIQSQTFVACAEVIDPEEVSGSVNLSSVPASLTVKINGEVVYVKDSFSLVDENDDFIYCTEEEKNADVCYNLYAPVCGNNQVTYANDCVACIDENVVYYVNGSCVQVNN